MSEDLIEQIKAIIRDPISVGVFEEELRWVDDVSRAIASLIAEEREKARLAGYAECGGRTVALIDAARASARREGMEEAAKIAAGMWPRGSAHTYASENADRYHALEDASEHIAAAIRSLAAKEPPMTDRDAPSLLSRLSAAERGSAELDREVLLACGWREELTFPYAPFRSPSGELMDRTDTPRPTRRLDDITRMIEAEGYERHGYDAGYVPVRGWVGGGTHSSGATPALALVLAFLRAREAGR